ncbi:type 1 glutamine amidotransferase [Mycobacterium sp. 21AC1]|uniref:gamma-glutamyl-gamma-aminobutyrate hydrolase family protein n=1 Tax=[Mycobacterium] appelbergii TaxID=2939269 RepID=UPI00293943D9|nr:type 1 glutamine amidotransferase [Mycobacterium sp. 21AC1]MDV3130063.1 type 1 glutamine amidotransferase [Mycobacterium sp. 21AC1]
MRPFIAIPAIRSPRIAGLRRSGVVTADCVLEAVFRAGGEPYLLPPGDNVISRLRYAHGAVIPGGADVDPASYGAATRHPRTTDTDPLQDAYDLEFTRTLLAQGVPFLAICRGMQVVNVALGGTLVQHLTDDATAHRDVVHRVRLDDDCAVAAAMGGAAFTVSSYHHQAIERLGRGLRVVGRADDDCIEAVEHTDCPMLAVQWHPEDDADTADHQQRLFNTVVAQANQRLRQSA